MGRKRVSFRTQRGKETIQVRRKKDDRTGRDAKDTWVVDIKGSDGDSL